MKKICPRCGKLKSMMSWETYCFQCSKERELERQQEQIRQGEEVDTLSSDYVICPYCGNAFEPHTVDDAECFEEGDQKMQCFECGKTFILNTSVSFTWETERICNEN